jgi:hypothetical protein
VTLATVPAGWYPDPADPQGTRWWSGEAWTDQVGGAAAPATTAWIDEPQTPELQRFTRDPALRDPAFQAVQDALPTRKDPYRERPVFAIVALIVALISIPGTIADALWELPPLVGYLFNGVPVSLAFVALLVSWRVGVGVRMSLVAIAVSVVTMVAGFAYSAQQGMGDLGGITVPGLSQLEQLQHDNP